MFNPLSKIAWLVILLCLAASAGAQEKTETPSQKSKDAMDKLRSAPEAMGKTLHALGKSVGAKLGLAGGEEKTAKLTGEIAPTPEKQNESKAPTVPVISKRDPFRPFTLDNRPRRRSRDNLTPLELYELAQFKLVGVIVDAKQRNAVVEDPLGFGYKINVGTPIGANEGIVKAIQPAGLIVEEFQFDVYGAKRKIERILKLAPEKVNEKNHANDAKASE